jgi:hypothetical protein
MSAKAVDTGVAETATSQRATIDGGKLAPDRAQAEAYLKVLDPTAKAFTFQTFIDSKRAKAKGEGGSITRVLNGSLDEHWQRLVQLNRAGAGIFVTVNATDRKGRRLNNITAVRGVWREADEAGLPDLPLDPTMIVESSPGKHHEYILTDAPIADAPEFAEVMTEMVDTYGSDHRAKDRARVLRLPGFYHLKDEKPPTMVQLVDSDGPRHCWGAIVAAFQPAHEAARKSHTNGIRGTPPTGMADIPGNLEPDQPAGDRPRAWVEDQPREELARMLNAAEFLSATPAGGTLWIDDYGNWLEMGMALHASCRNKDAALRGWKRLSQRSATWESDPIAAEAECDVKWLTFGKYAGQTLTLGTIVHKARAAGWNPALAVSSTSRFKLKTIAEVMLQPPPQWLIQKVVQEKSLTVIFGSSNAGKSFLVLDMALGIARGVDWFGRKVQPGIVVYLAIEGPQRNRLAAYMKHYQIAQPPANFLLVDVPVNLRNRTAEPVDAQQLIQTIRAQLGEATVSAVIIDTLNQALQGGEENSSEDMGAFIANANEFRSALGCAVLVVHHAGKDRDRGARGHSSLKGAVDTELEVTYDKQSGVRTASITKQRDGSDSLDIPYMLKEVDLGVDPSDPTDRITSCVVVPPPFNMVIPARGGAAPKGRNQKAAWQVFEGMMRAKAMPIAGVAAAVVEGDLIDAVAKTLSPSPTAPDKRRERARVAIDGMCKAGWFERHDDDGRHFVAPGRLAAGRVRLPWAMPEMPEMPEFA